MIAPLSGVIPPGEGLFEGLKARPAEVAFVVPSVVQDLAQDSNLLDYCAKSLELMSHCGGDPQAIGNVVASKIRLVNEYGASELGLTPNLLSRTNKNPKDWKHVQSHQLGLESCHVTFRTYELYAVRDPKLNNCSPAYLHRFSRYPRIRKSRLFRSTPVKGQTRYLELADPS